jgi:[ribosomal protein S5]-alanine N-acetyltransferase
LLEKISGTDAGFIHRLVNTPGWLQFIGNRHVYSPEDAAAYIQKINNTPDLIYWVVRIKQNQTPAGIISFLKRHYLAHFDIGFAFLPELSGNGYAFEAAKTVLNLARTCKEYETILATTVPENQSSVKLLLKLGLRFDEEICQNGERLHVYTTAPPEKV